MNSFAPSRPETLPIVQTDALIVGAGPAGLFQAFELGLLGIHAHVIDPLSAAGGQCRELYADKAIYDIPGLPSCTGQELIERLLTQVKPFAPVFHFGELVQSIERIPIKDTNTGLRVQTQTGLCFDAKAVILANGVGAFLPRALNAPEQADFLGKELFHGDLRTALAQYQGLHPTQSTRALRVWIVGGQEDAISNAIQGVQSHSNLEITVIHRRAHLDVGPELSQAFEALLGQSAPAHSPSPSPSPSTLSPKPADAPSTLVFKHGQIVHLFSQEEAPDHRLSALQWVDDQGQLHTSQVDLLMVNLGLSPQLGPIALWGAQMHHKQIKVNTEDFSTDVPGLFAIGDVITYPGKKKLILSGFHEAALASFGVAKWVLQKDRIPFEYTSASSLLQERLGVK